MTISEKKFEAILRKVLGEFMTPAVILTGTGTISTGPFPGNSPWPIAVPGNLPEPPLSGQRLPNGLWPYVTYTMLAGMPVEEMAQYTNLTPQQVHIWAQDKGACEIKYPAPNYLFK